MSFVGFLILAAVFLIVGAFAGGAVVLKIFRPKHTAADRGPSIPAPEAAFIQKETQLENTDPRDLLDSAPGAADHRARTDAIAESVRKRIRDRSRSAVSGKPRDGIAPGS